MFKTNVQTIRLPHYRSVLRLFLQSAEFFEASIKTVPNSHFEPIQMSAFTKPENYMDQMSSDRARETFLRVLKTARPGRGISSGMRGTRIHWQLPRSRYSRFSRTISFLFFAGAGGKWASEAGGSIHRKWAV